MPDQQIAERYRSWAIQWWGFWRNTSSPERRKELLELRVRMAAEPGWDDDQARAALALYRPAETKPWDSAEAVAAVGRVLGAEAVVWAKAQEAVASWLDGGWRSTLAMLASGGAVTGAPQLVVPPLGLGPPRLQPNMRRLADPDAELAAFLDPEGQANYDLSRWLLAAAEGWLAREPLAVGVDREAWSREEAPRVVQWVGWYLQNAVAQGWMADKILTVWRSDSSPDRPPEYFLTYMDSAIKSPLQAAKDLLTSAAVVAEYQSALEQVFMARYNYQLPSLADYWTPEELELVPPEALADIKNLMASLGTVAQGQFATLFSWLSDRPGLGPKVVSEKAAQVQMLATGSLSLPTARAAFGFKYGGQIWAWTVDGQLTPTESLGAEFQSALRTLAPLLSAEDVLAVTIQQPALVVLWSNRMAGKPLAEQMSFEDWLIGPGTRLFQDRMDLAILTDAEERTEAASSLRGAGQLAAAFLVERGGIARDAAVSLARVLEVGQRGTVVESLQSLAAVIPALAEAGLTAVGAQIDFLAELGANGFADQRIIQLQRVAQRPDAIGEMARATLSGQIDSRTGLRFFAQLGEIDPSLAPALFEEELVSPAFASALQQFVAGQAAVLAPTDLAGLEAGVFTQAEQLETQFQQWWEAQVQAGNIQRPAIDEAALRLDIRGRLEAQRGVEEAGAEEFTVAPEISEVDVQARFYRELLDQLAAATEAGQAAQIPTFLAQTIGPDIRTFRERRKPPARFRPFTPRRA